MSCESEVVCLWKVRAFLSCARFYTKKSGQGLTFFNAEVIEEAREKLRSTELTPLTAERFLVWKANKLKRKQEEVCFFCLGTVWGWESRHIPFV